MVEVVLCDLECLVGVALVGVAAVEVCCHQVEGVEVFLAL